FLFSSRRRHTRFSRDWSSDVCSSDLWSRPHKPFPSAFACSERVHGPCLENASPTVMMPPRGRKRPELVHCNPCAALARARRSRQIGRASCRERVLYYWSGFYLKSVTH